MRRNLLKQRVLKGDIVVGTMVQEIRTPAIAQILKSVGFDFLILDMEHGSYNLETAADILRVARLVDICPLVRVNSPEYDLIAPVLDQGAMGIMMPRVEVRDQVVRFLKAMKYPPVGERGCSSDAAHSEYQFGPLAEWLELNNADTLAIVLVERKLAVEHIDEILSVPGVDVAWIGYEDLSVSIGLPGQYDHPLFLQAIEKIVGAAKRHNVVCGIMVNEPEAIHSWIARGLRMFMYSCDLGLIMQAGGNALSRIRALVQSTAVSE